MYSLLFTRLDGKQELRTDLSLQEVINFLVPGRYQPMFSEQVDQYRKVLSELPIGGQFHPHGVHIMRVEPSDVIVG